MKWKLFNFIDKCNGVSICSTYNTELREAVNSNHFGDLLFVGSDRIAVKAHKILLHCSCEYFSALLNSGMKESRTGEVHLPNLSSYAIISLLEYLYTETVNLTPDSGLELLSTAHLLRLTKLKTLCSKIIFKGIDTETAIFVYQTAKLYDSKLMKQTIAYIVSNLKEIEKSIQYAALSKDELNILLGDISIHR